MTVNELARRSSAPPHVVRYYTRIGLLKPQRNLQNGYKLYADGDVARLRFIRQAKSLGFTLDEIAQLLRQSQKGESPCPMVRQIIEHRIKENKKTLEELMTLQERMEKALVEWSERHDGVPDGHTVCHLIESIGK